MLDRLKCFETSRTKKSTFCQWPLRFLPVNDLSISLESGMVSRVLAGTRRTLAFLSRGTHNPGVLVLAPERVEKVEKKDKKTEN